VLGGESVDVVVGASVVVDEVVVGGSVVVVGVVTVVVVVNVVDVVTVGVVLVVVPQGQASSTFWPTAFFRHTNASVAVTGSVPVGAQMHSGSQTWLPTAARKMKRQSVAEGVWPLLSGWLQSPSAACARLAGRIPGVIVARQVSATTATRAQLRRELRPRDPPFASWLALCPITLPTPRTARATTSGNG
jgi:hypothetical protein